MKAELTPSVDVLKDITNNWLIAGQQKDDGKLNTEDMGTKVIRIFGISAKLLYSRMQRNGKTRCLPVV